MVKDFMIDELLTSDKVVNSILADINKLPENKEVSSMADNQSWHNRHIKQLAAELRAGRVNLLKRKRQKIVMENIKNDKVYLLSYSGYSSVPCGYFKGQILVDSKETADKVIENWNNGGIFQTYTIESLKQISRYDGRDNHAYYLTIGYYYTDSEGKLQSRHHIRYYCDGVLWGINEFNNACRADKNPLLAK